MVLTKICTNYVASSKLTIILGAIMLSTNGYWRINFKEGVIFH